MSVRSRSRISLWQTLPRHARCLVSALSRACVQLAEMLVVERTQASRLDPSEAVWSGAGGPPTLVSRARRRSAGPPVGDPLGRRYPRTRDPAAPRRGRPGRRGRRWKTVTRSPPLPIYTAHGAFMKPWVVPHNRPPQARTPRKWSSECACLSRRIRRECGDDRACCGDRRRRSRGDDAGG
jgi:hypothetical protein